jgi:uroporphyrin-3 C-methyltransferase
MEPTDKEADVQENKTQEGKARDSKAGTKPDSEANGTEDAKQKSPGPASHATSRPVKAAADEVTPASASTARDNSRRGGGFAVFLALLFSTIALAGSAWIWWQDLAEQGQESSRVFDEISRLDNNDNEFSLKLTQVRDEIDTLASGDVSAEFEALQERMRSDRAKLESIEQTIRQQLTLSRSLQTATDAIQGRLQAAEAAVSGLSTRELDAGGELDLAEVDYLLRLANERLKLFSDPEAADQALEVADMHLAALDNPMYLGVRQEIAAARRALASVEVPDYLDIADQLDAVQAAIPTLAFKDDDTTVQALQPGGDDGWWDKVKGVFSGLVTVRRSTEDENQRISLEDKDYIRQRIWLQLEVAHLAMMRRDRDAFRNSVARTRESISSWFDPKTEGFGEVIATLDQLDSVAVAVQMPDITAPWSTLRLMRKQAGSTPPVSLPEAAEEPGMDTEDETQDAVEDPAGDRQE